MRILKNEMILSKCAGSATGNVFHLGGLPGVVEIEVISRGVAYHNVYLNCPDVNSEDT